MTTIVSVPVEGVLKRTIIEMAFEDCGLAGYVFERTSDEFASALRKLNTLMAEWPWNLLGFNQPVYGQGAPEEGSGINGQYVHAVSQYLAMRLAANMGKQMPPDYVKTSSRSFLLLQSQLATVPTIGFRQGTIRGQGSRTYFNENPFFPVATLDEQAIEGDPGDLAAIASQDG